MTMEMVSIQRNMKIEQEVVTNRGTNQEAASIVGNRLVELYRPDSSDYDVIKGYRADDSYTQVVEAFLLNQINI